MLVSLSRVAEIRVQLSDLLYVMVWVSVFLRVDAFGFLTDIVSAT